MTDEDFLLIRVLSRYCLFVRGIKEQIHSFKMDPLVRVKRMKDLGITFRGKGTYS